ncbi:hypothetical protein AOCH_002251 [Aspergillus ochraceoroseus]|uniref:Zn(2)-C6 fungal-type domain-containing protein n=1 Tax=Aspergillus ochraceoroseus TaxID=138278 RepID=A0A0F8X9P5_9EURO|nr:hypothetical protein AOCH_002251 [Aspergillus ochraceoroseus]
MPKRASGPRSRNGCITCKIRHVKCDEGKPGCLQCHRSGRQCDGYDSASQSQLRRRIDERRRASPPRPSISPDHQMLVRRETATERQYVEYFFRRTTQAFSGYFDSLFWSLLVPQLSEREPSIRHAMTAIGALHASVERARGLQPPVFPGESCPSTMQFVLEEYNKSIHHLMSALSTTQSDSTDLILTTCCLFVCLEILRENRKEALDHIEAGLRIISRHDQTRTGGANVGNPLFREIRALFARMNVQASLFGRLLFPLQFPAWDAARQGVAFPSMSHAREVLDQLMNQGLVFIRSIGMTRSARDAASQRKFDAEQRQLLRGFEMWSLWHDDLLLRLGARIPPVDSCASLTLRIYYHTSVLCVRSALERTEDIFDGFTADFETMIRHSEEIGRVTSSSSSSSLDAHAVFSLEGEIIAPLYYAACKCRHPAIRRRAVDVLSHYSKKEGMWDARRYEAVAKLVIEVEESSCASPPQSEQDIGSLARVYEAFQPEEVELNPCRVLLFLKPQGRGGTGKRAVYH